jgi:hypothetical protein
MKITVVEFKDPTGSRVYLRGVSVVTSVAQFREAVVQAFKFGSDGRFTAASWRAKEELLARMLTRHNKRLHLSTPGGILKHRG